MSMHSTPEDHAADPPGKWQVVKVAERCWHLDSSLGGTIGYYATRKAAEADRVSGPYVSMYERDGRWFAGQTPAGWKSYAQCVEERRRNEEWQARKAAERLAARS